LSELRHGHGPQSIILRRDSPCVIGDVGAHPDHQMLFITLIKKKQIPRLGRVDLFTDKVTVFLYQRQCGDKRLLFSINIASALA